MKKFFALALSLMMLFTCAAAEEIISVAFSMDDVAGIEGDFMALEDFGLMLFVPSDFVAYEPSEADIAKGVISVMGREDGSLMLSISYAGVADAEGNLITDLESLYAFYEASGVPNLLIAELNGLYALTFSVGDPLPTHGSAYCTDEGAVLAFNIVGADEASMNLGALILSSIMPLAE